MEENEYRSTYKTINERRCIFEKSINSRRCRCGKMLRFNLADREGVACSAENSRQRCRLFLELMRKNASFALQLTRVDGPLPHAKEIRVQTGGLLGLRKVLDTSEHEAEEIDDIAALLQDAVTQFQQLESLPFSEIVKSVVSFQGRKRRNKPYPD